VLVPVFMQVKAWKNRVSLSPSLVAVVERLVASGAKVVAVSFTSPYVVRQFPALAGYVCAYSPHPLSQRAAVEALWGRSRFAGRLPVDWALVTPHA
jgi:beta-N-acetylhexosaminidase